MQSETLFTAPLAPMQAKLAETLPGGAGDATSWLYEPKWDGLRAIVFHGASGIIIQGRDLKPLNHQFPELEKVLGERLPRGCIVDGEVVVTGPEGLDFDTVARRAVAAPALVSFLAKKHSAGFVAFDLLAAGGKSVMDLPQADRRQRLERLLASVRAPLYLTPMTTDRAQAQQWLEQFEGAGLDGVVAKPADAPYQPGKRVGFKVKHARTADCVVMGFRFYKESQGEAIGSLLLGLHDEEGVLQHVGVASSFSPELRKQLLADLAPQRVEAVEGADWEPLSPGRVCEVKYEQLQGKAFREAAAFVRWRDDKPAAECTFKQLEVAASPVLKQALGG